MDCFFVHPNDLVHDNKVCIQLQGSQFNLNFGVMVKPFPTVNNSFDMALEIIAMSFSIVFSYKGV